MIFGLIYILNGNLSNAKLVPDDFTNNCLFNLL